MKTNTGRNGLALLLGTVALATLAGNALAKSGDNQPGPTRPQTGGVFRPTIKLKQNDLAAMDLVTTFEGDPTQGTAKMIMVGTCKNLGIKAYQPGLRTVGIEKKVNGAWITQTAKTLPAILPGKTFVVSMPAPTGPGEYRLEVTPGGPADENPSNDIFVPSNAPVDPPK